jgi:hypothetical protein
MIRFQKPLLLGLRPFAIVPLFDHARLAQETQTCIARVSRNLGQLCDQHPPIGFIMFLRYTDSLLVL